MGKQHYKNISYTVAIGLTKPVDEVFNHLTGLSNWWPEDFVGESIKPGSEFVLKTGDGHYSKNKVTEFVPDKKLVWITTESMRKADNYDWTGTKFFFELTPRADGTRLTFTYDGIVLEGEQDRLIQICDFCIKDKLYNFIESFRTTTEVVKPPQEVFKILTAGVSQWWGGKDLSGNSTKLNDEFVIHHPGAHYSKQKLIEIVPDKKLVWQVTEGTLHWLKKDKQEWTNTKMIFELTGRDGRTTIRFTHEGLVPGKECYEKCGQGWNMVIQDYLYNYITSGKVAERLFR